MGGCISSTQTQVTDDIKSSGRASSRMADSSIEELGQNLYRPQGESSKYSYLPSSGYVDGLVTDDCKGLETRYSTIAHNYNSLEEVTEALARAGLESSKLIVGIDFTKSNEWTGGRQLNRRSPHHIGDDQNPYEQAISIIGKTLAAFDEDNLIPCFGFGDASTHDQDVFRFYPDDRLYTGFEQVLTSYKEIVPHLQFAGSTSFAPIIEMGMTTVVESGGQFHCLLIITSGQRDKLGPQKQETVDAIVKASKFPLSIILVDVGDGPWDMVKEFGDNISNWEFDNLQFVNFTDIMAKNVPPSQKEAEFALAALKDVPSQYKATRNRYTSSGQNEKFTRRVPRPPPYYRDSSSVTTAPPATSSTSDDKDCTICCSGNLKDMAFHCGHKFCCECGRKTKDCPICRALSPMHTKIELKDQLFCPGCQTDRIDMAFNCGDQACCECGEALQFCPLCESKILKKVKLF